MSYPSKEGLSKRTLTTEAEAIQDHKGSNIDPRDQTDQGAGYHREGALVLRQSGS